MEQKQCSALQDVCEGDSLFRKHDFASDLFTGVVQESLNGAECDTIGPTEQNRDFFCGAEGCTFGSLYGA